MAHTRQRSLSERLDHIERTLRLCRAMLLLLIRKENIEMAAIDDLKAEVARDTDVTSSAVTLLQGLHDQLAAAIAAGDPAAIQAVADQLRTNTDALAASVAQNTPAATP